MYKNTKGKKGGREKIYTIRTVTCTGKLQRILNQLTWLQVAANPSLGADLHQILEGKPNNW